MVNPQLAQAGKIERFRTRVRINDQPPMLVGDQTDSNPTTYRLFHDPVREQAGLAGQLTHEETVVIDGPNEHAVWFEPVGDDESRVEVRSLAIQHHNRCERLDDMLPTLRSDLTGRECTQEEVPTGRNAQNKAASKLANYVCEMDTENMAISPETVLYPEMVHTVARYPHDAERVAANVAIGIERHVDGGFEAASPEAFREVLLQYGDEKFHRENSE